MVLTFNYNDLQNIKEQMNQENITNNQKIYFFIESYKETLNFMYEQNLVKDLSKKDLEDDLQDFAKRLLKNTNMSYEQLERRYKYDVATNNYFKPNDIKLKL